MNTEKLLWPIEAESANTSSLRSQLLQSLSTSREYRQAFIQENIQTGIAEQIHSIRESLGMDQQEFAEKCGKKVSWIYRLEDPNSPPPTIPSLLEIAKSLDIALDVRLLLSQKFWIGVSAASGLYAARPSDDANKRPERASRKRGVAIDPLKRRALKKTG
jgi:transcriptional regulator with XRE-family HTH domain